MSSLDNAGGMAASSRFVLRTLLEEVNKLSMENQPLDQLRYLKHEIALMINGRWWRVASICFSASTWLVVTYRFDRLLYLTFGRAYGLLRILLLPILFLTRPWRGQTEIHYRAQLGKGLKILHPELGIVINGNTVAGDHLTLTGGNCIGGRQRLEQGDIRLGDNVSLGANAVILGPVVIGDDVSVGAGAVVIHDAEDNSVLVGVPAKAVTRSATS